MSAIAGFNFRSMGGFLLAAAVVWSAWSPAAGGEQGSPPRLLVLNKHDDSMMAFDLPSHRPVATVAVGDEPHEVAVTPDRTKAYISNVGDGSITVVDLHSWSVLRTLAPERLASPHGLGITHDGRFLLATSEGSRRFYQFDTGRDVLLRSLTSTEEGMHLIAMPARGSDAYVTNRRSDTITVLNAGRLRIASHLPVGPRPEGIALTPDGRLLLVALQESGEVVIMKAGSGTIRTRVQAGKTPIRIAVTPDGALALVTNRGGDDLTVIDLETGTAAGTVPVGRSPGGVVIAPDGAHAYVANNGSDTVSIVSIPEMRETGTLAAGAHPDGLALVAAVPPAGDREGRTRRSRGSGGGSP